MAFASSKVKNDDSKLHDVNTSDHKSWYSFIFDFIYSQIN